jgi:hypothetical protein
MNRLWVVGIGVLLILFVIWMLYLTGETLARQQQLEQKVERLETDVSLLRE